MLASLPLLLASAVLLDDTCGSAAPASVSAGTYTVLPNRSLGPGDLVDHYAIEVLPGQRAEFGAMFSHANGDIDMRLWNTGCTTVLTDSLSTTDDELVSWTNSSNAPQEVVVEVFLVNAPTQDVPYRFTLEGFFITCDFEDILEENDTCQSAMVLPFADPFAMDYLSIRPGDDDYFQITVPPVREQIVQVLENNPAADIDAQLLDGPCGAVITTSATQGWETLRLTNPGLTPRTFQIRVYRADSIDECSAYFLRRTTDPGLSYCTSAPNSTGVAAEVLAGGSASFASNDLTLVVYGLPFQAFGLFIYSEDQQAAPLGNGVLCVGPTIQRGPVIAALGDSLWWDVDYGQFTTSLVPFQAGRTYHFQAWFRDMPTGGFGFGLSDGYSVFLTP